MSSYFLAPPLAFLVTFGGNPVDEIHEVQIKLEYKRWGVQSDSQCICNMVVSMRCMYYWRDSIILEWERQCTATQTGHHRGMGACRLPEHTPHVHSHRGGGQCSQLWTQCAGCQSSTGGGGVLTAGEKEKQWTELEVIVLPTLLPTCLSETEMDVFYMPWYTCIW